MAGSKEQKSKGFTDEERAAVKAAQIDRRRFRPNLFVDTAPEAALTWAKFWA